jgi:hypothetical protein
MGNSIKTWNSNSISWVASKHLGHTNEYYYK